MTTTSEKNDRKKKTRRLTISIDNGLARIAAWQFAGFVILILLVWANEVLDFASLFYSEVQQSPDCVRGCMATAGIILAAVIVVGNTYLQHRAILSEVLTVCSYCHKIAIDKDLWQTIEDHLHKNPLLNLTHGICPDCIDKVRHTWEEEDPAAKQQDKSS